MTFLDCLKLKPQSFNEIYSRINPERPHARAELSILDIGCKFLDGLERVKHVDP